MAKYLENYEVWMIFDAVVLDGYDYQHVADEFEVDVRIILRMMAGESYKKSGVRDYYIEHHPAEWDRSIRENEHIKDNRRSRDRKNRDDGYVPTKLQRQLDASRALDKAIGWDNENI